MAFIWNICLPSRCQPAPKKTLQGHIFSFLHKGLSFQRFKKIPCFSQYSQVLFFCRRFLGLLRFDLRQLCSRACFHCRLLIRSTFHRALVGGVVGEDDVEEETVVEVSTSSSLSFLLVRVFRGFPWDPDSLSLPVWVYKVPGVKEVVKSSFKMYREKSTLAFAIDYLMVKK